MSAQRFGPYELVRRLGSGGMAETFLAVRRGPGGFEQHVCVKRILPFFESDPSFVQDFLEEARLAAQLRHANIAQVVDFGEVDGSHYLALELVDGVDLRGLLARLAERGERLSPMFVTLIAIELATALEFAHTPSRGRHAVVHRDLSPSNVLLSRAGAVYLTDFGIARALGTKRRTESGVVRGKVPYMAPEYALKGTFDGRTDLFGLGVVLFQALAGRRPFDGATDLDTLQRIKEGQHPSLASLAPAAPTILVDAIERLIRVEPAERFQSARNLIEALSPSSPPATAKRELGALVAQAGESLSDSLRLSSASRTASLEAEPAPSYPSVQEAAPGAETRTSDVLPSAPLGDFAATQPTNPASPDGTWTSTDPSRVSHHDRSSPVAEAEPRLVPATQPLLASAEAPLAAAMREPKPRSVEPAIQVLGVEPGPTLSRRPRRKGLLVALLVIGALVFAAATLGTYALVAALQSSDF